MNYFYFETENGDRVEVEWDYVDEDASVGLPLTFEYSLTLDLKLYTSATEIDIQQIEESIAQRWREQVEDARWKAYETAFEATNDTH